MMDEHEMRKKESLKSRYLKIEPCSERDYVGINVRVRK